MSKKRFLGIFAFLFVLLFSVACVFTACGKSEGDDRGDKGGVTLDRYEVIMYVGDVVDINASGEDKNGKEFSAFDYKWSYTGDDCITLELAGSGCRITAVSEGSATITVEAGNFSAKCDVVVKDVAVEKVTLDKDKLDLDVNAKAEDTITARAELNNKNAYDGEYSWKITEGEDIVEITPEGASCTVTAKTTGTAKITVTAEGKSATCTVTVTEERVHTHEYEASGTWSADYTTCEISLTCKNSDGLCDNVEVLIPAEDVKVGSEEVKADCTTAGSITYTATATYLGSEYTVAETVVTEPAAGHTFPAQESDDLEIEWNWEERDETACTVEVLITCTVCGEKISHTADYTARDETTLSGTLTIGGNTYTDEYTVEGKGGEDTPSDVYTIEINEQNVSLVLGDEENSSANLTATVTINGTVDTGATVSWYSDSENVVTVDADGLVTAVGAGEAKIYAYITTDEGEILSAYVVVKVSEGSASEELVTKVAVDFSDSSTYAWMTEDDGVTIANDTSYSEGMLTLVSSQGMKNETTPKDSMTIDTSSGILKTGGTSSEDSGRYFVIDLSDYVGVYDYVSITAVMKTGSNGNARSLYVDTDYAKTPSEASETILSYVTSSQSSDKIELEYVCAITEDCCVLYLTCDANISIYSLIVEVGNDFTPTPEAESVTLSADVTEIDLADSDALTSTVTASVTMKDSGETYDGGYTWTVTDADGAVTYTDNGDGTLTFTAVATGSVTINVRLWSSPKVTGTVTVKIIDSNSDEPQPEPGTGDEDGEPTLSVNKTAMSFNKVGQTDYSIYTLVGGDGETYGGGSYEIKVETSLESVAAVSYADGKIAVTSVGAGSATITITLMNGGDATEQVFTISVTVAISNFTADDTTYTVKYTATKDSDATTGSLAKSYVGETDEAAEETVKVGTSGSTDAKYGNKEKGEYTDYLEITSYGGRNVAITVSGSVTADIIVYASHSTTNSTAGNIYIRNVALGTLDSDGKIQAIASQTIDGSEGDTSSIWAISATNLSAGAYYVYSETGDTIHVYAVEITYKYDDTRTEPGPEGEEIYNVTVSAPYGKERITVGYEMDLIVTVTDASNNTIDVTYGDVKWTVDDTNVITLEEDTGHITGNGVGDAVITATYTDSEGNYGIGTIYITVIKATSAATGDACDINVDFSQYAGKVGTDTSVSFDEKDVVTYIDWDAQGAVADGALGTTTYTYNNGTNYTNYILIDFTAFMGYNFEITVTFSGDTGAILAVVDSLSDEGGQLTEGDTSGDGTGSRFGSTKPGLSDLVDVFKGAKIESGTATFTYSGTISEVSEERGNVNDIIYIVWDSAISISGITIELWTGEKVNKLPTNIYEVSVDFSDPSDADAARWGEIYDETNEDAPGYAVLDEYGFIQYADHDWVSGWYDGRLTTQWYESSVGYTHMTASSSDVAEADVVTNYFIINLAGHSYVEITIMFGQVEGEGVVAIDSVAEAIYDTDIADSTTIFKYVSTGTGMLTWYGDVTDLEAVYIVFSAGIDVYSINVNFYDTEQEGKSNEAPEEDDYTIEIDEQNIEVYVNGDIARVTAKITLNGVALPGAEIEWTADPEGYVTISRSGIITAIYADADTTVKITATYTMENGDTITAETTITVHPDPDAAAKSGEINISVDFSNRNSRWAADFDTKTGQPRDIYFDSNSILEYVVDENSALYSGGWMQDGGYLATGTTQDAGLTRSAYVDGERIKSNYFVINLGGLDAETMTITIVFSSAYDYGTNSSWLEITKALPEMGFSAQSTYDNNSRTNPIDSSAKKVVSVSDGQVTFTWTGDVSTYETLYIIYTTSLNIYSIDITLTVPSDEGHEHVYDWENAEWQWSDDHTTCTAIVECTGEIGNCYEKTKYFEAVVTYEVYDATCTEDGYIIYTATYTDEDGESKQVSQISVTTEAALGHVVVGTYSGSAWSYECTRDNCQEEIVINESPVASVELVANNADALQRAAYWNQRSDIIPVVHVTETYMATTSISFTGCEKLMLLDGDLTIGSGIAMHMRTTVTIDLNGRTISKNSTETTTASTIEVGDESSYYGDLTVMDGSAEGTGTISGYLYTITVWGAENDDGDISRLTVESGAVTATYGIAISTNGRSTATEIIINGGKVSAQREDYNPAIYLPSGTLYVNDGEISGATGIEVRGGKAYLLGGTITSIASEQKSVDESTSDGGVADGYAIAITWNSSYSDDALVEISGASVTVNGAIYASDENAYRFVIFAGNFTDDPEAFLAEGFTTVQENGYYVVVTAEEPPEEEAKEGKEINVSFSDNTTVNQELKDYLQNGSEGAVVEVDLDGLITYNDMGWESGSADGSLSTSAFDGGGFTKTGSQGIQNYFEINLSDYINQNVSFTISISKYASYYDGVAVLDTSLYDMSNVTASSVPDTALSYVETTGTKTDLEWTGVISGEGIFYLMYSNETAIYSIDIVIEGTSSSSGDTEEPKEKTEIASFGQNFSDKTGTFYSEWWDYATEMHDDSGNLTYVDYSASGCTWDQSAVYIITASATTTDSTSSSGYTNYFVLDLSEYLDMGCEIQITIKFKYANTVSSGTIALVTELWNYSQGIDPDADTTIDSQAGTSSEADFVWSGSLDDNVSEDGYIYIVYDNLLWIYDIEITILG